MKSDILDYTLKDLEKYIIKSGEKRFRAEQIFRQLHKDRISELEGLKNIPKELIIKLGEDFYIGSLKLIDVKESKFDRTKKFLFEIPETDDRIESVLIVENERITICISTQAGCNVGCEFCATGKIGFKKNLSQSEIISQIYQVSNYTGESPTNLVYMGMGEPFLNYENVFKSLLILTNENGLGLSSKRITVSTIGLSGKIKKFADDLCLPENAKVKNTKLAFSLHSTDNGFREKIIPISKKNPLPMIYEELNYFYKMTRNKITFEYVYFEGLNDTDNDIKRLSKLTKMFPCNINVIPFHPIDFPLKSPLEKFYGTEFSLSKIKIIEFIDKLKKLGSIVNLRNSSGVDIFAACGQLAAKNLRSQTI